MEKSAIQVSAKSVNHVIDRQLKSIMLHAPAHLLKPLTLLPHSFSEQVMKFGLNRLFNQALQEDELSFLYDKYLKLMVTDTKLTYFISVEKNIDDKATISVLTTLPRHRQKADVEFSSDTSSLLLLASKRVDPDTLFFQRKLLVTGHTELGLAIKNFLDEFDFQDNLPTFFKCALEQLHNLAKARS